MLDGVYFTKPQDWLTDKVISQKSFHVCNFYRNCSGQSQVFSVIFEGKGQLIITESNSWDSDHWKSENSILRLWNTGYFSSQFRGQVRVCLSVVHSPLRKNHWVLVKNIDSDLSRECPESISPQKMGTLRNLHLSRASLMY